jgi:hypothetical protein
MVLPRARRARPEQVLDLPVQALLGQYRVYPGHEPGPDLHSLARCRTSSRTADGASHASGSRVRGQYQP